MKPRLQVVAQQATDVEPMDLSTWSAQFVDILATIQPPPAASPVPTSGAA